MGAPQARGAAGSLLSLAQGKAKPNQQNKITFILAPSLVASGFLPAEPEGQGSLLFHFCCAFSAVACALAWKGWLWASLLQAGAEWVQGWPGCASRSFCVLPLASLGPSEDRPAHHLLSGFQKNTQKGSLKLLGRWQGLKVRLPLS